MADCLFTFRILAAHERRASGNHRARAQQIRLAQAYAAGAPEHNTVRCATIQTRRDKSEPSQQEGVCTEGINTRETRMRNILLATTAAAALLAGTCFASGQGHQGGQGGRLEGGTSGQGGTSGRGGATVNQSQGGGEIKGTQGGSIGQRSGERGTSGVRGEERGERGLRGEERGQAKGLRGDRDDRNGMRGDRDDRRGARDRDDRRGDRDVRGDRDRRGDRDVRGDRDRRGDRDLRGDRDRDRFREGREFRDRDRFREGREFRDRDRRELRGQIREDRGGRSGVRISEEQRTRIHSLLLSDRSRLHRLDRADFAVRVGARVPRTVEFFDLPSDIVEVIPTYRRYKYILVGDELVIV